MLIWKKITLLQIKVIEDFKHIKSKGNTIHILRAAILNVLQRMPKWITPALWT